MTPRNLLALLMIGLMMVPGALAEESPTDERASTSEDTTSDSAPPEGNPTPPGPLDKIIEDFCSVDPSLCAGLPVCTEIMEPGSPNQPYIEPDLTGGQIGLASWYYDQGRFEGGGHSSVEASLSGC